MPRPFLLILFAYLLTAGCSGREPAPSPASSAGLPPETTAEADAPQVPAVSLVPDGLRIVVSDNGSTRALDFGMEKAFVRSVLSHVLSPPADSFLNAECGAGPLFSYDWPNGLSVLFQDGAFAGWSLRAPADSVSNQPVLTTFSGLGLGSSRSDLTDAYDAEITETSLGTEFSAGALSGLLSSAAPDATVAHLWAGTTCIFR